MWALLSVSDKRGIVDFARGLLGLGFRLLATGGTHRALAEAGLPVTYISEFTGFPEILEGRVKTLHPKVHAGLLARPDQEAELRALGLERIGVLAVNLYPFRETVARGASYEEALEQVDIGGPAMLRAAAKNHMAVLPVCDPADYPAVLEALREGPSPEFRRALARKAFAHTARYDAAIAEWLSGEKFPEEKFLVLERVSPLRYGENPHQEAALYRVAGEEGPLLEARVLQGKAMSFNNYLDAEAAWNLVSEFAEPACVAVKHQNPCGVALGETPLEAYQKAYRADPVSIFGGIVAFNREVDGPTAEAMAEVFLEVVLAPGFSEEALRVFARKKNLRLLEVPTLAQGPYLDLRRIRGGVLLQDADTQDPMAPQVVTQRAPGEAEWRDLLFAWKVVKHVRSNAIVVAKEGMTLGIGVGQTNRYAAAKHALKTAKEGAKGAVLASDAFFPFDDVVRLAAEFGIAAIIQPGGSVRDKDSIQAADEAGMAMVFTGVRHFRH
ncbi:MULTISPECIES: bifunctional phosphoribosylaminoimidazolecarboxamide formyltransferase/IMP cyclohydrolase [Thermus]|jgi:phosphoribosylaminoimidazolecarboxamide formyltransferase/IMP cyclohydrolase|uniref:Bifunctional purine biosynthesis protein PurH n=1 Tax=Thermus brockianus TaxID=56956 RepID=A0A1J0LQ14_THEBO|nr:bifunctional phosphoribosylaminoimidazolecarboxamide formyltransferase/IMP cyclohydrolase [Thermus brockianus]APD08366.1 bifunctional phosphoribosylaminoimidazolecarboxamide formyltransferase/IMP cyclohydrolase [Thermus brockianus]BDG16289.1 bifunctional purine biosynthesis protein PurH [Thermus brockianus]